MKNDKHKSADKDPVRGAPPSSLPSRNQPTSRAQKIVDNARRKSENLGNVENLSSTRIERGTANGKSTLTAIFPQDSGGNPDRLDISFLLEAPGLTDLFADGIMNWFRSNEHISRMGCIRSLRRFWFTYITEQNLTTLIPSQIDEQIMAGFHTWLHQLRKANGEVLKSKTIARALSNLRCIFAAAPNAGKLLDMVPAGPRGSSRGSVPTKVLQFDQLLKVMAATEKEILTLSERWESGRRLIILGRQYLQDGRTLHRNPWHSEDACAEPNLALALAILDHRYPGVIPKISDIAKDDPLLAATVQYAIKSRNIAGYFYASSRDLVPLVLSIATSTAFNPDTILKLAWRNIDRKVDRLGNGSYAVQFNVEEEVEQTEALDARNPLTKITGDKPRARRQLVRLLDPEAGSDGQANLNLVLDLLVEMTKRIRPLVIYPDTFGDRVFLFVQTRLQKRPKGFGIPPYSPASDISWFTALKSFITENSLPDFTLRTIRATLLDYIQILNRGDLEAARKVGNHRHSITTWTHYTSDFVKMLLQEAAGETMLVRERWHQSGGTLDPRKFREWSDKGCATPGFTCLDPFDSPRFSQKKGKLCTAYGECPDCPLAAAHPSNPKNVMLYEALRSAIYRSVTRMTATVWQQRWAPIVASLDSLLESIPSKVLEESRKLRVKLPDIG